ncbi:MAG: hypothetical protein GX616_01985, partial [Planctomycetes bacterium]|nr:hypothetical protein [Planctomycetota bacterium]
MELKEYIIPLKKWWWLIVAATLIATVSSYMFARRQPYNYQASTTLLVGTAAHDLNPTGNEFYLAQQLATTYVEIVQRESVRNNTLAALSLPKLPPFSVRMIPNTQLIEIAVVDSSPARAQAVANELANQLIRLTPSNPEQEGQLRQAFINEQLNDLEVKI